jgi:hypothetical protein
MKRIIALLLLLMMSPAAAGQIDYFCLFANQAAAQADVNVGVFWNTTSLTWDTSTVFPGVKVVTPAALVNGISPILGLWIIVSRPIADAGLDADAACQVMKWDRDSVTVLNATLTGTNRTLATLSPAPFGSTYAQPFGK